MSDIPYPPMWIKVGRLIELAVRRLVARLPLPVRVKDALLSSKVSPLDGLAIGVLVGFVVARKTAGR